MGKHKFAHFGAPRFCRGFRFLTACPVYALGHGKTAVLAQGKALEEELFVGRNATLGRGCEVQSIWTSKGSVEAMPESPGGKLRMRLEDLHNIMLEY